MAIETLSADKEQHNILPLAEASVRDDKIIAAEALLENRRQAQEHHGLTDMLHTSPAAEHYPHLYLWDSCFFIVMYSGAADYCYTTANFYEAQLFEISEVERQRIVQIIDELRAKAERYQRAAIEETFSLFNGQKANGFIPNMQHVQNDNGRAFDLERILAFDKEDKGSNYTQPPVAAIGVASTYEAMKEHRDPGAELFLQEIYGPLKKFYQYFDRERSNSEQDKLTGVIHPHETGRDSDPTFDFIKNLRFDKLGTDKHPAIDKYNVAADYMGIIWHGMKLRQTGGDMKKAREVFWVNDIMMNCIYVDNLLVMAELAANLDKTEDSEYFEQLGTKVEAQMLEKMWFAQDRGGKGAFRALDQNGQPIREISISNLFPLALPHLLPEQVESVLDMMDTSFDTPYPLPSVAADSPKFDPHNRETHRLWRGPTWINTNWYVVERGLRMQAVRQDLPQQLRDKCTAWADRVAIASKELLDKNGAWEHYDPLTGAGQRERVKNFGWSWLGRFMQLPDKKINVAEHGRIAIKF